jgi:hypothetical protein
MKKSILLISLTVLFALTVYAAEEMKSHDMQMSNSGQTGKLIREANLEGYRFSYHLIDMQAQMKNMEGMQHNMQQIGTHHLMLDIQDAEGKTIDSAQVGYLIIGPDGSEQKVMTMGMSGAYGADINLSKPGEYIIKCKAVVGEKKLLDEFKYKIDLMP